MRILRNVWRLLQGRGSCEEEMQKIEKMAEELSPEEVQEIEAMVDEHLNRPFPEFTPRRTALFSTMGRSRLYFFNRFWYRWHIRLYADWLLEHGYFTFVVNYGTRFGYLAMEELLDMRREGGDFRLCAVKVSGERCTLHHKPLDGVFMSVACDQQFGQLAPSEYLEKVMGRVDHIACEAGLCRTLQKIPRSVIYYYQQLSRRY